jgi:hypothetical protein
MIEIRVEFRFLSGEEKSLSLLDHKIKGRKVKKNKFTSSC